jgi:hypothetical protein
MSAAVVGTSRMGALCRSVVQGDLTTSHLSSLPCSRFNAKSAENTDLSEAAILPGMAAGVDMQAD